MSAALIPSGAAHDAAIRKNVKGEQPEDPTRRGGKSLSPVPRLRPENGLRAILGALPHCGTHRIATPAADADI